MCGLYLQSGQQAGLAKGSGNGGRGCLLSGEISWESNYRVEMGTVASRTCLDYTPVLFGLCPILALNSLSFFFKSGKFA